MGFCQLSRDRNQRQREEAEKQEQNTLPKIQKKQRLRIRCSKNRSAGWLGCKQLNQSCTNPVAAANPASLLTHQPVHSSPVSVGVRNVSTHLAMSRKPKTQLVRVSTHSFKQHVKWRSLENIYLNRNLGFVSEVWF